MSVESRRSPASLSRRIWWTLVGTVAGVVAAAVLTAWFAARSLLIADADTSLERRTERIASHPPAARRAAADGETWRGGEVYVRLILPGGAAAPRGPWPAGLPDDLAEDRKVTATTVGDRRFRLIRFPVGEASDDWPPTWHAEDPAVEPLPPGSRLLVAFDVTRLHREIGHLGWILAAAAATAVLLAATFAGRLRDALLAPLRRLDARIQDLPTARLDARLGTLDLPPELAQIRERIDELLGRLAEARTRERRTIADIAHELRTPLATMRSELGFASPADDRQGHLAAIGSQVAVLQERIEGLLLLSRLDIGARTLRRTGVTLADAVADAWAPLSPRARAGNRCLELHDPDDAILRGDATLIGVLLGNLLGNAIDHGAPGPVAVVAARDHDTWILRVTNPSEDEPGDRSVAFEAFWRRDPSRSRGESHSGLGLAVVKSIADAHGAEASATVDRDRRFVVELRWPTSAGTREAGTPSATRTAPTAEAPDPA